MSERKPIRTAIVGLGRAGYDIHIAQLRQRGDYIVTAVVDPIEERREEVAAELGCDRFASLEECLARADAELVVITTPSSEHARQAIAALEAGRHVLVEKPMATSVVEADRMIATQKESGRILTVHQQLRLDPVFCYVRNLVGSGRLGEVFHIRRFSGAFARRNDWQTLRKYGGGMLNNNGVHLLDQLAILLGAPVRDVWGDLQRINYAGDAEDHVQVLLRGYNGRVAEMVLTSACALPQPEWFILGTRGSAVIQRSSPQEDPLATLKWYEEGALPPLEVIDAPAAADRTYGLRETIPFKEQVEPATADTGPDFYSRLYASIREGAPLLVEPITCRAVLDIIGRARVGTRFQD